MSPCLTPLLLVRTIATRQVIMAASPEAREMGIRPGMTLAQARAVNAQVAHAEHDPARDARALEALARWLMRFSPIVAMETGGAWHGRPAREEPWAGRPCHIFLDVTGCERVFGGLDNLMRQADEAIRRLGITARLAIAPTPGAAWAMAFVGWGPPTVSGVVGGAHPTQILTPFPPAALRLDVATLESLRHLGVATIGQLMTLPRESLPARFGAELLMRLDQALGLVPEPLIPLAPRTPIRAGMEFESAIESIEAIWIVFKELLGRFIPDLERRGQGIRRLEVQFRRPYAPPIARTIFLSRPSRDPVNLFNLFRCTMENVHSDDGFIGLRLLASVVEPIAPEQIHLLDAERYAGELELAGLIERLQARLGAEAMARAELVESYVPEKRGHLRFAICDLRMREGKHGGTEARRRGRVKSQISSLKSDISDSPLRASVSPWLASSPIADRKSQIANALRPLHLLSPPVETRVMVSPSEDRDGRPVSFTRGGEAHRVTHFIGPERIAGAWWEGHDKTRDYFEVEIRDGRRFWIFRVMQTGRWYLHGVFE